ncbi:MAG: hypothetical protein AAFR28_12450 [Pseudomonadota bacterium]
MELEFHLQIAELRNEVIDVVARRGLSIDLQKRVQMRQNRLVIETDRRINRLERKVQNFRRSLKSQKRARMQLADHLSS